VPKAEHSSRDFYDVWLPDLAPSAELVKAALGHRSVLGTLLADRGAVVEP
jgi:uncharacterized protein YeaO (DUF488 family)